MSVHLQIKKQINTFIAGEKKFQEMDARREALIEEILADAKAKKDISLLEVNAVTEQINNLSRLHGFPMRKQVTKEMVNEYINRGC